MSETFLSSAHGVHVILEWTEEDSITYSYDIMISTSLPLEETFNGSSKIQLTLSYNIRYNVSVVATHPCGHVSSIVASIELYYQGKFHTLQP